MTLDFENIKSHPADNLKMALIPFQPQFNVVDARLCAADDPAFCCLLNNYVYHEKIIPFPICHSMVVQCLLSCLCAKCAQTSGCISHGRDASCQLIESIDGLHGKEPRRKTSSCQGSGSKKECGNSGVSFIKYSWYCPFFVCLFV
jgi:hypothetical protein